MIIFPSWRYHASLPACIVADQAESDALGAGWYDSPAKCMPDVTALPAPPVPDPGPATVNERQSKRKR